VSGEVLSSEDMAQPAMLTVWPHSIEAKAVEPRALPSLNEALAEAGAVLRDGSGTPWIITEGGLILTPTALRMLTAPA
jgi:hypothetical protein